MLLECTLSDDKTKASIPWHNVVYISETKQGKTYVYITECEYPIRIEEEYEDIKDQFEDHLL